MAQLIDKAAVMGLMEERFNEYSSSILKHYDACTEARASELGKILVILNALEVKDDSLENFKSLQHISRDLKSTLQDWGYAPNLYFCDGMWHVSWISCEEGDSIKDFESNTPEDAIDKACNWFHSTFCNS